MATEDVSPRFHDLDAWPTEEAARALFEGQLSAVAAVQPALPAIAEAADKAAARLKDGAGRIAYVGAGTSGRLGVQDGAELAPTFDWPEARIVFLMAGGPGALLRSVENAEDSRAEGAAIVARERLGPADVLVGVAASGTTPFTIAALAEARRRGALTIGIANNADAPLAQACECPILVVTGAEVLAGSTRMKAGTAQKVVLNLFSTLTMIRLGRVYRGMMVDMRPTNAKLRHRSATMVAAIAACEEDEAERALAAAGGDLKLAALVATGLTVAEARDRLDGAGGNLRLALEAGPR